MILGINHVALLTNDLDRTSGAVMAIVGGIMTTPREVDSNGTVIRTSMLRIGADKRTGIQFIEPEHGELTEHAPADGTATIWEIAVEVDDIDTFGAQLRRAGFGLFDFAGNPLTENYATAQSGTKYLYLRPEDASGVRFEIVQQVKH